MVLIFTIIVALMSAAAFAGSNKKKLQWVYQGQTRTESMLSNGGPYETCPGTSHYSSNNSNTVPTSAPKLQGSYCKVVWYEHVYAHAKLYLSQLK